MVVKLDLRINKQTESSGGKRSGLYYAAFAMGVLFLLSSLLVLSRGLWNIYQIRSEKAAVDARCESDINKTALMAAEFKRLQAQNKEASEKLDFLLSGAPTVEFLYELGERTPDGVVLESVNMTNTKASLKGVAFADEEVVELGEALSTAKSVASVAVPTVTAGQREGISLRQFSFEVMLNSLQDIMTDDDSDSAGGADVNAKNGGATGPNEAE